MNSQEIKALFIFLNVILILLAATINAAGNHHQAEVEDNEFAEFEEFEDEEEQTKEETKPPEKPKSINQGAKAEDARSEEDEAVVEEEDEESEFDHFQDEEEFEGFDQDKPAGKAKGEAPDLKITKVPLHLRTSWDSFYLEMLMIAGLVVYFINFIAGKNTNQNLANAWFNSHKQLLEQNFYLVGDDGKSTETEKIGSGLLKESENIYTLWCSGRTCCEGMLVELRFLKRQDLVHVISQMLRPACDQIVIKITMNTDDMDSFVFVLANKKTSVRLAKDMNDISTYCPEKKNVDKFGLPSSFQLLSEVGEVTSALIDSKVTAVFNKYEEYIDYIHFSDQYSGPKLPEDSQPSKLPEVKKVLIFSFNVPGRGKSTPETMEAMRPLTQLVFHCMEKVKRLRLSKEAKQKAEKNRLRVEEAFLKTTHQQRAEAAQVRREEKRRAEKERILNEDDPDKQRRWEEKEHRRELKKRAPKMKQLKVKAL